LNDGARYNLAANTWTTMTTVGAAHPRESHTAVWTGNEMVVWGGYDRGALNYLNDTVSYSPSRSLYLYQKQ
jgi:N-acetylneuraminic acid mutarotase